MDTLLIKCRRALKQEGVSTLVMAGGVSANRRLRERLAEALAKDSAQVIYPAPSLCTDNGAMIAFAGALRLARGERDSELPSVRARWPTRTNRWQLRITLTAGKTKGTCEGDHGAVIRAETGGGVYHLSTVFSQRFCQTLTQPPVCTNAACHDEGGYPLLLERPPALNE